MKSLFCLFSLIVALLLCTSLTADAYFGDTMTDVKHFSLAISGEGDDHNTSLTALFPLKFGWLGLHHSLQTRGDGDTIDITNHIANVHLQGVQNIGPVNLEGYVELIRNKKRDIEHAIGGGYFIRPPKVTWNSILFSVGAGNWTQRIQPEIGKTDPNAEARVGWLSFASASVELADGDLSAVVRYKPTIDFDVTTWELSTRFNYPINVDWLIGVSGNAILEDEEDLYLSHQIMLTYTP